MSRKIYFDPRSKHIGMYLKAHDFEEHIEEGVRKVYIRGTLEIVQQDGWLMLVNRGRKEQITVDKMFDATDLDYFIRSGNFPASLIGTIKKLEDG